MWFRTLAFLFLAALLFPSSAHGQVIESPSCQAPFSENCQEEDGLPGIRILRGRLYGHSDFAAAFVSLCSSTVHVTATAAPTGFQTTSGWAADRGVQLAVNGDFYESGPRVYGDAVGDGIRWPAQQTGNPEGNSWTWYYKKYGWIAFGPDWVDFTHSKWVKENTDVGSGWAASVIAPDPPPGTLALVSGFPQLVIDGAKHECLVGDCFADRGDMRDRHPRSAMGLSEDSRTLILAVVDGRSTGQSGAYGYELADLMYELGSWQAFNLDGGGSSEMWLNGSTVIDPGDHRAVANHWGVFSGALSGMPEAPGHCLPLIGSETDAGPFSSDAGSDLMGSDAGLDDSEPGKSGCSSSGGGSTPWLALLVLLAMWLRAAAGRVDRSVVRD